MGWITLLAGLVKLALVLTKYLGDNKLIEAGAAMAISASLQGTLDNVDKAQAARRAVDHSPDAVLRDPDNRDRR